MQSRQNGWRDTLRRELGPAFRELGGWLAALFNWLVRRLGRFVQVFLGRGTGRRRARWIMNTMVVALVWVWSARAYEKNEFALQRMDWGLAKTQVRYLVCTAKTAFVGDPNNTPKDRYCYRYQIARSYSLHPLIFEAPLEALFAPWVMRHLLVICFGIWAGFKLCALYMAQVYDLSDLRAAEHYLLQSGLINPLSLLDIQDDELPRYVRERPVFRIGGPGRLRVDVNHAALFERIDGAPRVIGPTADGRGQTIPLDSFERLRTTINLRDQRQEYQISGRSKDGIRVTAGDVQSVFSIYRAHREPTYQRPYPFQDPEAVRNLVYNRDKEPWTESMKIQVRGELLDFFAERGLTEFLATIQQPEMESKRTQEAQLRREGARLSQSPDQVYVSSPDGPAGDDTQPVPVDRPAPGPSFTPRPEITEGFYTSSEERRDDSGVQINWIGVGTWTFPQQVFDKQHQDAWALTHDNAVRSRPMGLEALQRQTSLAETLRLVQSVPIGTFNALRERNAPDDLIMRGVILGYRHHMNEALDEYERYLAELVVKIDAEEDPEARVKLEEEHLEKRNERDRIQEVMKFFTPGRWL